MENRKSRHIGFILLFKKDMYKNVRSSSLDYTYVYIYILIYINVYIYTRKGNKNCRVIIKNIGCLVFPVRLNESFQFNTRCHFCCAVGVQRVRHAVSYLDCSSTLTSSRGAYSSFLPLPEETSEIISDKQHRPLVCHLHRVVRACHSEFGLLVVIFQNVSSKWGLWIHTLLHICFCGNTERFLKRGVLGRSWRTQQNHTSGHLVDSHDLCMWTEDTWVVYHWLSLDELWADPANVTVTLAFIRFAGWLSCVGKDKSITC